MLWYEAVLTNGARDEIEQCIDGTLLIDLWPELELPTAVQSRWQKLIDEG